jgi:hypothetical protein
MQETNASIAGQRLAEPGLSCGRRMSASWHGTKCRLMLDGSKTVLMLLPRTAGWLAGF